MVINGCLRPQNRDDRADKLLAGLRAENGDFSNHQLAAGGEQLTGPERTARSEPELKLDGVK